MTSRPAYNPFYGADAEAAQAAEARATEGDPRHLLHHAGRPRVTFSLTEVLHIAAAILVLTFCLAIVLTDGFHPLDLGHWSWPTPRVLLASLLAIASGFVLHELAHKVVAQRYGHWAEFRAQFLGVFGLVTSLLVALGLGFLMAAPGAVVIQGAVTRRENGVISLVGPGTNLVVGVAATIPYTQAVDPGRAFPQAMALVAIANAGFCLFNLLPVGQLDGRKVLRWNPWVYAAAVALAVAFVVFLYVRGVIQPGGGWT